MEGTGEKMIVLSPDVIRVDKKGTGYEVQKMRRCKI
jgi:hypothetical protein